MAVVIQKCLKIGFFIPGYPTHPTTSTFRVVSPNYLGLTTLNVDAEHTINDDV